jgi:ADP-heptose:LPS heptosyltransferase
MQEKILVIKLSALGDFILALGAMEAIRRHHKKAHITLLTTKLFVDMAQRSQYFDEIWTDPRPRLADFKAWISLFKKLNSGQFTRVYDLQMNDRTRLYHALFLKKPEWSGVIRGTSHFHPDPNYKQLHAFERHKQVLKTAGIDVTLPDISWMASDISMLRPKKPYILLIPGSAPQHPQKRWPALRYGALAGKLLQQGYEVAVLGTQAESGVIDIIKKSCSGIIDLSGKTSFYDIATLAREAAGAVGNDTGPTHLVSLAGCPTTVLFSGASRPELSAPVGDVQIIQSDDIADIQTQDVLNAMRLHKSAQEQAS